MFNVNEVEQTASFGPLEPGVHKMYVYSAELKNNKAGTGDFFAFELRLCDGDGRCWANFTFNHSNPTAVKIGRGQMADLLFAAGIGGFADAADLDRKIKDSKDFLAVVTHETGNDGRERAVLSDAFTLEGKHRNPNTKPPSGAPAPKVTRARATKNEGADLPF